MALQICFSLLDCNTCRQIHSLQSSSPSPSPQFHCSMLLNFLTQKHNPKDNQCHDPNKEALTFLLSSSRRKLNLSILALIITGFLTNMSITNLAQESELQRYTDSKERFTLLRPSSYVKVDKSGATVLFEEVNKGSNNVGVVVSPVRLTSLGEFGTPEFVADKLIQADRRKITLMIGGWKEIPEYLALLQE